MDNVAEKLYKTLKSVQKLAAACQNLDVVDQSKTLDDIEVAALQAIRLYQDCQRAEQKETTNGSKRVRRQSMKTGRPSNGANRHLRVERPENV